jgi:tRNA dimethylallyltransferase
MSFKNVASNKLVVVLGPTAVGKTNLATNLAFDINAEIISADSRQVYCGMDLGTGKDINEYEIEGEKIPYHLIDILDAGEAYNLYRFQQDFYKAYSTVLANGKTPILCGGTGLYINAAIDEFQMHEYKLDPVLRTKLDSLNQKELIDYLKELNPKLHNSTDIIDRNRTVQAIELLESKKGAPIEKSPIQEYILFGIRMPREQIRERIKLRLEQRLEEGMVEEVKSLLDSGISYESLLYYGLEYRFIAQFLKEEISYQEMFDGLLQAIRRFAKKQMTWFRRMEKKGTEIVWLDSDLTMAQKIEQIKSKL